MIGKTVRNTLGIGRSTKGLSESLDVIKINQGLILSHHYGSQTSRDINDYEFKVFSQFGDDGIIQFLTRVIDIEHRTFIEFGVEDFSESNCRFLMQKDNWSGFVIDGSEENIERLKNFTWYWRHDLQAVAAFINADNINHLLELSGFDGDLGILNIDIDGVDYYVLEAIQRFRPRILITEYNSIFGARRAITVPYRHDFIRTRAHPSNLFYGASLPALQDLASSKGYTFVGCNSAGNNGYFIRDDLMNDQVRSLGVEEGYVVSKFRESRDQNGRLTHLRSGAREDAIRGMTVYNVRSRSEEPF